MTDAFRVSPQSLKLGYGAAPTLDLREAEVLFLSKRLVVQKLAHMVLVAVICRSGAMYVQFTDTRDSVISAPVMICSQTDRYQQQHQ